MNVAPPDTQLQTRDPHGSQTAAEKDLTQRDSCPETEYAELDTPPRSRKGLDFTPENKPFALLEAVAVILVIIVVAEVAVYVSGIGSSISRRNCISLNISCSRGS